MKKNFVLVLLSLVTVGMFASCNKFFFPEADELPANAQQFINQYFSNNNILNIEKDGSTYDVHLTGNVEIEFYSNGEWKEVDCNNSPVPSEIIPSEIADFMAQNYPDNFIVQISRNGLYYEIELNNGLEFEFNLNNNNGGNNNGGNNNGGNNNGGNNNGGNTQITLPDAILQFITENFANATVVYAEIDDFKYEVTLSNGVELEFDMNGNWIEIDCNNSAVPAALIPANIANMVATSYPNNYIVKIGIKNQKYEVELNNGVDLVFDINGNFLYID